MTLSARIAIAPGVHEPIGLTLKGKEANFAVHAPHAKEVDLCLFGPSTLNIAMQGPTNGIWHISISPIPPQTSYAYRIDKKIVVSDPYARSFSTFFPWGDFSTSRLPLLSPIETHEPFDWQGIEKPRIPMEDLIIYEMHVRGFTKHPSSRVPSPGTYAGVIDKIPYLKQLGITAVELMPVYEFDETHAPKIYSATQLHRINYWGYNPISFFAPVSPYASKNENAVQEFKTMVRGLHRAKIEVILDVVYNHTSEGNDYLVSMRSLDKNAYYMIDENGKDRDYTGCGNTFQSNTLQGQQIILESLRYWAETMQIDGFRFDLAAILTRGTQGEPLSDPPILKAIAEDPVLSKLKLIAEPWDATGLSQVGQFHKWGPWAEWNGSFRDHVRRFIKGTENETGLFAASLCGSEPTFPGATPQASINFVTAHDGFCLRDLVTYQHKHNIDNGENNRDGSDQNFSWNCGAEGPTQDMDLHELRERQMRNFWLALLLSQGIPMILMGDEIGHTRKGNNNPYVQDNEINWFDWEIEKKNHSMLNFVSSLISFRKTHTSLRKKRFLKDEDITWHGHMPHRPDWKVHSRFIACTLNGESPLYMAFNADFRPALVFLPEGFEWKLIVNTADSWERHNLDAPKKGQLIGASIEMLPYSAILAEPFPL